MLFRSGWNPGNMGSTGGNYSLTINGGYVYVNANGDGLDSNGTITVNDGVVIVNGPTSSGDSPIDADGAVVYNGGTILGLGSTGMISEGYPSSGGYVASTSLNAAVGTQIVITDANGEVLGAYTTVKQSNGIIFSSTGVTSYKIYTGGSRSEERRVGKEC